MKYHEHFRGQAVGFVALAMIAVAMTACNDSGPGNGSGDTGIEPADGVSNQDAAAGPDIATDGSGAMDGGDDTGNGSDTTTVGDTIPTPTDTTTSPGDTGPANACATAVCDAPNRGVCVVDNAAADGYRCDCDAGYLLDGETCIENRCDDESATTGLTVIDVTPLAGVPNPVSTGFDPLLKGDTVRVHVDFARTAGNRPLKLQLAIDNLVLSPTATRLDGVATPLTPMGANRFELTLPAESRQGRLSFEGTIPETGPGLLALEARLVTTTDCRIAQAASGARIQLTGSVNPKHAVCNDMNDLRSLQISTGVLDKDTSVYEQRNGDFEGISSIFKILTQMTLCIVRPEDITVSLAGSADGTRPWTIDNFLLIEIFDGDPAAPATRRTAAWVTTSWAANGPSQYTDGTPIRMLSHASLPGDYTGSRTPSPFSFPAGTVQLNRLLPAGQRTWLRLTGLDSGVAGHLSRLFIHAGAPGAEVAECRTHRDCPREDSYDGLDTRIRAGCVAGRCTPIACGGGTTCQAGQTCIQNFCTDACTSDGQCPAGQVCGYGGVCTTVGNGGCKTFEDCPRGEVCFFGRCEGGCFQAVAAHPTYAENHSQYSLCRLSPAACPRCPNQSDRCWSNYCRECEIDAHCTGGKVCRADVCVTP